MKEKKDKLNPPKTKKIVVISILVSVLILSIIFGTLFACGVFTSELKKASKKLNTYTMDLSVSNKGGVTVLGKEKINYKNTTGASLSNICLHLYARAFREVAKVVPYTSLNKASCFPNGSSYGDILISRVNIGGSSANFEYAGEDQDILKINLSSPLQPNKKTSIEIDFTITLANCTHRLGYYKNVINLGNFYPIICHYNKGWQNTPYYSTGDPFVSECANYVVNISYPAEYKCFASGSKISENTGKSCFNALAVRDFAIVLNNSALTKTEKVGSTSVTYVGYSGDSDVDKNLQLAKQALSYFSDKFGKYPYDSLVVAKSAFMQGGMEYPNLVIISDSITEPEEFQKVIVHEIAHQWWYGLVGNNQVTSAWLDESLAEYSTCLFFEDHSQYGKNYSDLIKDATGSYLIYVDVISSLDGKVNTAMNLPVNKYATEYEYTYMVYVKGVIMFDSLREVSGKNKLIGALKKYFNTYKFKIATEGDFISCMQKHLHKDLKNFFSGWLNGTNVVGYVK